MQLQAKIGWKTAAGLVIANMIGTGVFTSLGFQLMDLSNTWSIILLWFIGGAMALIGAFTYAELGTHFQKSGGDYIFLSKVFHPLLGYLYAWTSLMVGFSAPIAIAAIAMTNYLDPFFGNHFGHGLSLSVIIIISVAHSFNLKQSSKFQDATTLFKVLFVIILIIIGFWAEPQSQNALNWDNTWTSELLLPGFAVSLIYVFYAYTGWNAAAYIIEEIDQPRKNLPKALISGTILVMILYILVQVVFLKHATFNQLNGKVDVANIAFSNIFPIFGAKWISIFIALQLIGTISGYTWIGPRVTHAMAIDFKNWKPLSKTNKHGIPVRAIWLNTAISILLTLTGTFEQVLLYAGFVLQLMATLTVISILFVKRNPNTFKSPFKPFLQLIYLIFSLWVLAYTLIDKPFESLAGLGLIVVGIVFYRLDTFISIKEKDTTNLL